MPSVRLDYRPAENFAILWPQLFLKLGSPPEFLLGAEAKFFLPECKPCE